MAKKKHDHLDGPPHARRFPWTGVATVITALAALVAAAAPLLK